MEPVRLATGLEKPIYFWIRFALIALAKKIKAGSFVGQNQRKKYSGIDGDVY